jgi:septal ring factor EnvC (AmiA/AmiB activator)
MNKDTATQGTEGQPEGAPAPAATAAASAPTAPAPAPAVSPAPAATAAAPLSFGQRLSAAAASLNGKGTSAEVESLKQQLATITGERDSLRGSLQAATDKITGLQTDLAAANTRLAEAETAVTDFEKKVARASIDLCAASGVPLADLPAAEANGEDPAVKLRQELAACKDPARKGKIAAQLAAMRQWNN